MKHAFFLLVSMMWLGCTDRTFTPQFKVPKESIIAEIQKIISAESVRIDGYKVPIGDSVSLWLNVGIINPKNLPEDNALVMEMRKRIAVLVKNALKDPNQFKVYDIAISYRQGSKEKGLIKTESQEMLLYDKFDVDDL